MIKYYNCEDVEFDLIFNAFKAGFSDYIIKAELTQEDFEKRFFGPEGNSWECSYIALSEGEPVGLVLGGIRQYEGLKTLRCGTMCVHPQYRGKGISKELFAMHRKVAKMNGCKQMFLEVLTTNERAVKLYKTLGYEKIYDLNYYTKQQDVEQNALVQANVKGRNAVIQDVTFRVLKSLEGLERNFGYTHINWQNSFDSIEKMDGIFHYGIFKEKELISAISIDAKGKIYFIWTKPSERNQNIASSMLQMVQRKLELGNFSISSSNSAGLAGFLKRNGFAKGELAQFEMYLWII